MGEEVLELSLVDDEPAELRPGEGGDLGRSDGEGIGEGLKIALTARGVVEAARER